MLYIVSNVISKVKTLNGQEGDEHHQQQLHYIAALATAFALVGFNRRNIESGVRGGPSSSVCAGIHMRRHLRYVAFAPVGLNPSVDFNSDRDAASGASREAYQVLKKG